MSTRFLWFLSAVLLLALVIVSGVSVGLAATRSVSQPYQQTPVIQGTPAFDVTHIFIRNNAYRPDATEVTIGAAITWTNEDSLCTALVCHIWWYPRPILWRVGRSITASRLATLSPLSEHLSTIAPNISI